VLAECEALGNPGQKLWKRKPILDFLFGIESTIGAPLTKSPNPPNEAVIHWRSVTRQYLIYVAPGHQKAQNSCGSVADIASMASKSYP
jgi:hypothetical protein